MHVVGHRLTCRVLILVCIGQWQSRVEHHMQWSWGEGHCGEALCWACMRL